MQHLESTLQPQEGTQAKIAPVLGTLEPSREEAFGTCWSLPICRWGCTWDFKPELPRGYLFSGRQGARGLPVQSRPGYLPPWTDRFHLGFRAALARRQQEAVIDWGKASLAGEASKT